WRVLGAIATEIPMHAVGELGTEVVRIASARVETVASAAVAESVHSGRLAVARLDIHVQIQPVVTAQRLVQADPVIVADVGDRREVLIILQAAGVGGGGDKREQAERGGIDAILRN